MKKLIIILFAIVVTTASVFAQAPQKMSYQSVLRNNSNALISSRAVSMRISILQGSSTGNAVYIETQMPITNANGLVSLEIGAGNIIQNTFASINWAAGPYFVKTETDPDGGTNYTIAGVSQLMSVPFALFAANGGTPGPQGPQGVKGLTGNDGATGPQGAQGPQGVAGTPGAPGAAGVQGLTGATGAQGDPGETGLRGIQGITGATGAVGPTGPIGATGDRGQTGVKGDQGIQGIPGPQGAIGMQGVIGATGPIGPEGIQGLPGRDGLTITVNGVTATNGDIRITKSDIGLGNVENTSDLNKPISAATQTALDLKIDITTGKGLSTNDYTTTEQTKLAAITGSNTGDDAPNATYSGLVSNASHTGDVTGAGLLTLATVNTSLGTYNNITINEKGLATSATNVLYLTPTGSAASLTNFPTLNQNTTGISENVSGTVAILNGGTGATTQQDAAIAILPQQVGNQDKVLTSDGTNARWAKNIGATAAILGTLSGVPSIITNTTGEYTGSSISLPPGKWLVQVSMMLENVPGAFWVRSCFSSSNAFNIPSPDVIGATNISGYKAPNAYALVSGSIIIENTSLLAKTYYFWSSGVDVYSGVFAISNFGSGLWHEDQMIALPIN